MCRRSEGRGLSRKHIIETVQASLSRLQLSYIDIVMIHKVDPMCPMEGKPKFCGCSLYAEQSIVCNALALVTADDKIVSQKPLTKKLLTLNS